MQLVINDNIVLDKTLLQNLNIANCEYNVLLKYFNKINKDITDNYYYRTNAIENYFMQKNIKKANSILNKYNVKISINYM